MIFIAIFRKIFRRGSGSKFLQLRVDFFVKKRSFFTRKMTRFSLRGNGWNRNFGRKFGTPGPRFSKNSGKFCKKGGVWGVKFRAKNFSAFFHSNLFPTIEKHKKCVCTKFQECLGLPSIARLGGEGAWCSNHIFRKFRGLGRLSAKTARKNFCTKFSPRIVYLWNTRLFGFGGKIGVFTFATAEKRAIFWGFSGVRFWPIFGPEIFRACKFSRKSAKNRPKIDQICTSCTRQKLTVKHWILPKFSPKFPRNFPARAKFSRKFPDFSKILENFEKITKILTKNYKMCTRLFRPETLFSYEFFRKISGCTPSVHARKFSENSTKISRKISPKFTPVHTPKLFSENACF